MFKIISYFFVVVVLCFFIVVIFYPPKHYDYEKNETLIKRLKYNAYYAVKNNEFRRKIGLEIINKKTKVDTVNMDVDIYPYLNKDSLDKQPHYSHKYIAIDLTTHQLEYEVDIYLNNKWCVLDPEKVNGEKLREELEIKYDYRTKELSIWHGNSCNQSKYIGHPTSLKECDSLLSTWGLKRLSTYDEKD